MKDPAFLFYPGDWLGGTMGMTFEEKGAYMELLMLQFNRGHMTKDMIGHTVGRLWDKIKDKFIIDDNGLYYNGRLEEEKTKRQTYTKSRRNNRDGNNQYTEKTQIQSGHMTGRMVNVNKDKNNNKYLFIKFWNLYDKKVGKKEKVEKKYNKLSLETKKKIFKHLVKYKEAQPNKQYRKNPDTYLNNDSWNDEIIKQESDKHPAGRLYVGHKDYSKTTL